MKQQKGYWQTLVPSPTKTNESLMLELSRTWEPTNRKLAHKYGVGKKSLYCVFSRNMDGRSKTSSNTRQDKV